MSTKLITNTDIHQYLREIGRIPRITQAQEIIYGRQIRQLQTLIQAKNILVTTLGREPNFLEWSEATNLSSKQLQIAISTGENAKRRMMEANLRLVVHIAKQYAQSNRNLLDLVQEGAIGMQQGIERFDPSRGYRFSTYVSWWIRRAIVRAIGENTGLIRLPFYLTERVNKIHAAQRHLTQKLGRSPTIDELSAEVGFKPKYIGKYLERSRRQPISLEAEGGVAWADVLEDTGKSPEELVAYSLLQQNVERMMAELTPRQRRILVLRFGLQDDLPLTLSQVSDLMNISRERVRQIEREAIFLLRHRHKVYLQEYLTEVAN